MIVALSLMAARDDDATGARLVIGLLANVDEPTGAIGVLWLIMTGVLSLKATGVLWLTATEVLWLTAAGVLWLTAAGVL